MTANQLHWSHGEATVLTTAAMLAECRFILPSGPLAPFARAPWLGTVTDRARSGQLRVLGGDFVGLPFGMGREVRDAPPVWAAVLVGPTTGPIHGPAADRDWDAASASDMVITLTLDYPETSPVLRVERVIAVWNWAGTTACCPRFRSGIPTGGSAARRGTNSIAGSEWS